MTAAQAAVDENARVCTPTPTLDTKKFKILNSKLVRDEEIPFDWEVEKENLRLIYAGEIRHPTKGKCLPYHVMTWKGFVIWDESRYNPWRYQCLGTNECPCDQTVHMNNEWCTQCLIGIYYGDEVDQVEVPQRNQIAELARRTYIDPLVGWNVPYSDESVDMRQSMLANLRNRYKTPPSSQTTTEGFPDTTEMYTAQNLPSTHITGNSHEVIDLTGEPEVIDLTGDSDIEDY